jgi:hypothetical protein
MGTSVASAIWAQKRKDFRAHPFKRPEKWISSHSNPYVQPHINNWYIGNFMDKRQEARYNIRAHSEMIYNKRVRSLRGGGIKGVEGWEGWELEGENKRGGGGWGVGGQNEQVRYES